MAEPFVASPAPAAHAAQPWLAAAEQTFGWMRGRDFAGHDPQDALASPLLAALTLGSRWLGVAWTQLGKRTPPRWRSLLGVPQARNAKGIGLVVAACVRLERAEASGRWRREAQPLIDWLETSAVRDGETIGWGYPFPWANRDFFAPAKMPSGVATAFVAHALLDCAEAWEDARASDLAVGAARFMATRLNRLPLNDGYAFSYTPIDRRLVHNASVLCASVMARVSAVRGDAALARDALAAAYATAAAQNPDGSWAYGAGRRNAFIDSFHTSYLLVALDGVRRWLGAGELDPVIARGVRYWRDAFFVGPAVGFAPRRPYPIEQHGVAHAITALRALADRVPDAKPLAERLAAWSLREMRASDGAFYYRQRRNGIDRAKYMRWTQAWMLLALAELAEWSVA